MHEHDQLDHAQNVAAILVDHCRQLIENGTPPASVCDGALLLAVSVITDHLDPDQATDFAAWLRQWADNVDGSGHARQ